MAKKEEVKEVENNEVLTQNNNEVKEEMKEEVKELSEMERKAAEEAKAFMEALQVEFTKSFEASMKALEEKQKKEKEAYEAKMKDLLMKQAAIELKKKKEEEERKKLVNEISEITTAFLNSNIEKYGAIAGAIIKKVIGEKVTTVTYTTTKRTKGNIEEARETNKATSIVWQNEVTGEKIPSYELLGVYVVENGLSEEEAEEIFTQAYNQHGRFDQHFIHMKTVEYIRRGKARIEREANSLNSF